MPIPSTYNTYARLLFYNRSASAHSKGDPHMQPESNSPRSRAHHTSRLSQAWASKSAGSTTRRACINISMRAQPEQQELDLAAAGQSQQHVGPQASAAAASLDSITSCDHQ